MRCRTSWPRLAAGRRRAAGLRMAALGAAVLLAGGCGIRATSVPVDAGAAPSRASCSVPSHGRSGQPGHLQVRIYLVCTSQVRPVTRAAELSDDQQPGPDSGSPVRIARLLLDQLERPPTAKEAEAGFSTQVADSVRPLGLDPKGPDGALRLSRSPEGLPSSALAQIICTFAGTVVAGPGRVVVLGGPDDHTDPLRRYTCTEELRNHPEIAVNSGVPVS